MKKILFFIFAFSTLITVAQNKSTVETRALMQNFKQAKSIDKMSKSLIDRFPLRQDKNGVTIGVTAKVDANFDAAKAEVLGIKVTSRVADIVAMRMPIEKLALLNDMPGIVIFSVAHRVYASMDRTRLDTRTDSIHAGIGVPMPFDGEGVLVGITDWGFDYTHPNINKKNSNRILRTWDHFRTAGPAPEGFDYGTELTDPDVIYATKCDTFGLYGHNTHGTHVAGIIGGIGTNGHAIGQAPKVKYLLGSWFLDEASWLDQAAWMFRIAKEEGKRMVINGSWGMYNFSTLDGTSLLSQAINSYSDSGIVFVTSGGNNGDENFHIRHRFEPEDTIVSLASYYSSGVGQSLIFWGEAQDADSGAGNFKVFFSLKPLNGDTLYSSPIYSTTDSIDYLESYVVANNDTVRYDILTEEANPLDGRPHILLNVGKNFRYRILIHCTADSGTIVNIWNLANTSNNAGNMGCGFQNGGIHGALNGDPNYGIGEPACAAKAITVAAHNSDSYNSDSVYIPGAIASFSSYGPTLDGRDKPEISAPGVNVVSSYNYWDTADRNNYNEVYFTYSSGHRYRWVPMSGTSMSGPAVTGVVALMLQANPNLTVDEIRDILIRTARNDEITGPLQANDSVSVRWGHGKVDALKAVNAAYDMLDINQTALITPELVVFPNPTDDQVIVRTGSNRPEQLELFAADGRLMFSKPVYSEAVIDLSSLASGVYYVRVHDRSIVRTAKVVKK